MLQRESYEETALQRVLGVADEVIDGVAARMGLPPGGKTWTRAEEIGEWTFTPFPDPQERMNKALELHLSGKTPEEITDALYPNIRRTVTTGRPKVDEQIAYARSMRPVIGWPDEPPPLDDLRLAGLAAMPPMQAPPPEPAPAPVQPTPMATPEASAPMTPPAMSPGPMASTPRPAILPAFNEMGGL